MPTTITLEVPDGFQERVRIVMERTGITTQEEFYRLACQFFDFATEKAIDQKSPLCVKAGRRYIEIAPFWLEGDKKPN